MASLQDTGMPPAAAAPATDIQPLSAGIQAVVAALKGNGTDDAESVRGALRRLLENLHVTVDNPSTLSIPNPLPVSGTVAVTGPLTDAQLRLAPLAVEIANDAGVAINVSGPATNAELRATPLQVAPARGALTDRSGTIAVAGTSQKPADANATRTYLRVHNPDTVDLWVNYGAAASATTPGSFRLFPGGSDTHDGFRIPTDAVHVSSAKAGAMFTIKEG